MVELKDVVKTYGNRVAIDHVSLLVNRGSTFAILGQPGAGKSTLLGVVAGTVRCNAGQILINGTEVTRRSKNARRHVGFMPEGAPLYGELTVGEFLRFSCGLKGVKGNEARDQVGRLMETTKLGPAEGKLIKYLPKGMRNKVALAGALAGDPKLLLLDQPTFGADPISAREIRSIIKDASADKTVIVTAEALRDVADICRYAVVLNEGKAVSTGAVAAMRSSVAAVDRVRLTVMAGKDTLLAMKQSIPQMEDLEILSETLDGVTDVMVEASPQVDIRRLIWEYSAKTNMPILEMKRVVVSADDVLLRLTGNRGGAK